MTVREKVLPDGTTKVHLFLDPSQTLNEAIIIPRYQIPTVIVREEAQDVLHIRCPRWLHPSCANR